MLEATSLLTAGLFQCLSGLPLFLVWVVAGVLITQRMASHRTAAYLALGGIALGVLELIIGLGTTLSAPVYMQRGASVQTISVIMSAVGVVRSVIAAVSWGLVLAGLVMALAPRPHPDEV